MLGIRHLEYLPSIMNAYAEKIIHPKNGSTSPQQKQERYVKTIYRVYVNTTHVHVILSDDFDLPSREN